jgi:hypothetical protein
MSKKIKFIVIFLSELFLLFTLLVLLPTFFLKEKEGIGEKKYTNTLPLNTKNSYLEPFTQNNKGLNSISVLLKNPGLLSKDSVKIELLDEHMSILETLNTSGISIEDPGWVKFKFTPINVNNKIFYIKVSSTAVKDNLLYIYGDEKTGNINFKTTYRSLSLKESFLNNLIFQKNQFINRSSLSNIFFFCLVMFLNFLVLISL